LDARPPRPSRDGGLVCVVDISEFAGKETVERFITEGLSACFIHADAND
jgi:hypothetical protein